MILQPQAYFTVVRQIGNHTDSATYYVRAVIRNAYSDEIITTLDLVDKGSQRFKKDWLVAADASGQGFYISIVTSVYTDSGYTTKSENYGDEENTYLVQERVLRGGGGGGGSSLTRRDVRDILQEEIAKLPQPAAPVVNVPKQKTVDLSPILEAIRAIKIPKAEKPDKQVPTDLAPVLTAIADVKAAVEGKEVTRETDITPIIEKLDALGMEHTTALETVTAAVEALPTKVEEVMSSIEIAVAPTTGKPQKKPTEEDAVPFDLKQLAL